MNRITTRRWMSFFQQHSASRTRADKGKKWLVAFALIISQVFALAPQASAEVLVNNRLPFTALIFNQCTGEQVQFSGIFHQVIKRRVDKNGTVYLSRNINAHGEGEGVNSGNRYIWNDTFEQEQINPQGCAISFTNPDSYLRLISKGSLPNQLLEVVFTSGLDENCQPFQNLEIDLKCVPN